jgi:hypothetical protein
MQQAQQGLLQPGKRSAATDPHAMRRRILEVLAAHPEGLHQTALARELGYGGDLGPTLRAMRRDEHVRRVGPGVYAVGEDAHHA